MITRGLLLAGYLFLFAGQFNYRYFAIANFYVYSGGSLSGVSHLEKTNTVVTTVATPAAAAQHTIALHNNSQRPAHLGIDKRYEFMHGIRVPQIRAPEVVYIEIVKARHYTPATVFISISLPTNALRGPPCA